MRGCGRVSDGRLGVAEIGRDRQHAGCVDQLPGRLPPACNIEGDDSPRGTLLAARKIVRQLGVVPLAPEWRSLERRMTAEWELQSAGS